MLPLPWTPGPAAPRHPAEVTVMASELRLRRLRDVPRFLTASMAILRQTRKAPGAVGVTLRAAPLKRTFWTLSAWESREAINAFVRAEPHRSLMVGLRPAMAGSVFTFWQAAGGPPPTWAEADRRIEDQRRKETRAGTGRPDAA
ncbi:DUF3291 domain-containing protein [Kitasatospora camelliae]|uniref:DUF3291 domain-containing protein n=1 Tax=Kitasatospora camelliae TaxID=3156397 RepID=A0AAU8JUZ5_9ACTN